MRNAEVVGFLACTGKDPTRPRVVTVADAGFFSGKTLVATHAVGAAPTKEKPLHPYVYRR